MHRFFIPPAWVRGIEVTITGEQAHQIAHVLRMRPGDLLIVLDNSGWEIETRLVAVDRQTIRGEVVSRRLSDGEPRTKVSLYQGVMKGQRFEFALQKGTEVGIVEFLPVICGRCTISDLEGVDKKRPRWERIVQEAAEQSRRGRKPAVRPALLFSQACEQAHQAGGLSLVLWEGEAHGFLRQALREPSPTQGSRLRPFTVRLLVGPEGGFADEEVNTAQHYGWVPVGLGRRILRSETAGIVAAAIILYELGDMQ